ncbi:MAG TPA: NEW3 domain-containing protein [Longimicrobiales bacterium]
MPRARGAGLAGVFVAALWGAAQPALAQRPALRVERRGPALLEADAGSTVTAVFRVVNAGGVARRFVPRIELPAGWRVVTGSESFDVPAGGAAIRLIGVAVPSDARPGEYRIGFEGRAGRAGEGTVGDFVRVFVRSRWRLELQALEAPRFVVAGEAYTARFRLVNRGNASGRVRLSVRSAPDLPTHTDSAVIGIGAGAVRIIGVEVETAARTTRMLRHHVALTATAVGADSVTTTASSTVDVYPGGAEEPAPDRRLPAELRLHAVRQPYPGAQFEFRGGGRLHEGSAARVDFLARRSTIERSAYRGRDEYRLSYRGERFDVWLGDQIFRLSPLTATGRYAFGIGARARAGGLLVGGYAHRNRRQEAGERTHAAQLGYRFGRGIEVAAHYLARIGPDSGQVASVRGTVRPWRNATVDVEYGRRLAFAAGAEAWSVDVTGGTARIRFDAGHLRADPDYPGAYRGTSRDHARLSLGIWRRLRLEGSAQWQEREVRDRGALFLGDRATHVYTARLAYGHAVSAEYRREGRAGRQWHGRFDRELESVGLQLGVHAGGMVVQSGSEFGTVLDRVAGRKAPFRRHSLQASLSPGYGQSYSARVEYLSGSTVHTSTLQERLSVSLHATAELTSSLSARLAVQAFHDGGELPRRYALVDAGIEHTLPFGHRIAVNTRVSAYGAGGGALTRDAVFTADYVIPLGLPVPGRSSGASARIRVHDARTGEGIAGIPVHLGGRTVISDDDGTATFRGLRPGTYPVRLDRQSLGLDRVAMRPLPAIVTVDGDRAVRMDIGISPSARLTGTVRLFEFERTAPLDPGASALVEAGALRDVVIELSREGEALHRVTDGRGRFEFADLAPGEWTLAVVAADLPPNHDLAEDTIRLHLAPGDAAEVTLRALPHWRPVRIIDSGEIAVVTDVADAPAGRRGGGARSGAPAREYRITSDDISLMNISRIVYDDASLWPKLWLANRAVLPDPDVIRPGQVLRVPPKGSLSAAERRARDAYYATPPAPPARTRTYRVAPGDFGLRMVARTVYGDPSLWPKLWVANRDAVPDPDYIRAGQLLRIPPKAPLTPEERRAKAEYHARVR